MSIPANTGLREYSRAILLFVPLCSWQMMACLSISDSMQLRNSREVMCKRHSSRLWVISCSGAFCSRRRFFLPLCFSGTRFGGVLGDGFHQIGEPEDIAGKSFWRFLKIFSPTPVFLIRMFIEGHVNARKNAPQTALQQSPRRLREVFGRRIRQQIECVNERQGRGSRGFSGYQGFYI